MSDGLGVALLRMEAAPETDFFLGWRHEPEAGRAEQESGGEPAEAQDLLRQALASRVKLRHRVDTAATLEALGEVHLADGELGLAAYAFGVADELRRALGAPLPPDRAAALHPQLAAARSIDPALFEARWSEGRQTRLTDVLGVLGAGPGRGAGPGVDGEGLGPTR